MPIKGAFSMTLSLLSVILTLQVTGEGEIIAEVKWVVVEVVVVVEEEAGTGRWTDPGSLLV